MAELRITPRAAWHLLHHELLALLWAAASLVASVVVLVAAGPVAGRVAMALSVLWCLYVGWQWGRFARRKVALWHSGIPTLVLDDLGIRVRTVLGHLDGAWLAWADCAAVVVSRAPAGPVSLSRYVQFVPLHEDRVEGRPVRADRRPVLLGLSPTNSLTAWPELRGQRPDADDVVAGLRVHRPALRLVGVREQLAQSGSPE